MDAVRHLAVTGRLPEGFDELAAEAHAEGYRFLARLALEWRNGAMRFDRAGEILLAAYPGDVLAAIGGLTRDPQLEHALRMRRFYVRPRLRRRGIGRDLAGHLLATARGTIVTVNAAPGSELFWEALGFRPDARDGHTHIRPVAVRPAPPEPAGSGDRP